MSEFICNKCKRSEKDLTRSERLEKVVIYDLAAPLCLSCRQEMKDEINQIARKYLT